MLNRLNPEKKISQIESSQIRKSTLGNVEHEALLQVVEDEWEKRIFVSLSMGFWWLIFHMISSVFEIHTWGWENPI